MSTNTDLLSELGLLQGCTGPRGLLIALEALDKTPKEDIIDKIRVKLLPQDSTVCHFPDKSTATGKLLDRYLKRKKALTPQVAHLLFSANRWEGLADFEQSLRDGTHVLLDRYTLSGTAYSAARMGDGYLEFCKHTDWFLPHPDVTIYLRKDPETLLSHSEYGSGRNDFLPYLCRVDQIYKTLIADDPTAFIVEWNEKSVDTLADECFELISKATPTAHVEPDNRAINPVSAEEEGDSPVSIEVQVLDMSGNVKAE